MSKKKTYYSYALVIIIIMGFYIYNYYEKNYIAKDFGITGGKIIDYSISGDVNNNFLTYEYYIESNRFYRDITTLNQTLDSCYDNLKSCQEYRLMVVYSNQDNSKSLINLNRLYVEGEQINKDEIDLDDFK